MTGAIERVSLTHLQIPFKEPFQVGGGEVVVKDAILVTVETTSGLGIGECSPPGALALPLGSDLSVDACWEQLCGPIAASLLGRTFSKPDDIAALASTWRGCSFAAAGAETACWDLLGRARHATLADLLGASPEQIARGVESGLAVGPYPTIVELLRAIETHLAEGYRRVKITIRPGADIEHVRAVRQHFGEVPLMVAADAAYTAVDIDIFRALDDLDLLMIEQPLASNDLDGLTVLQAAIATPVCLDATAESVGSIHEAIERGGCRIVNLKIQRLGGLGPALAVHDDCLRQGVACWVGTMPELGVGRAQGIHLAALPNCRYPTDIEPSARWFVDDYISPLLELSSPGLLSVPTRPGLGFEIDHPRVRRYQIRQHDVSLKMIGSIPGASPS